jgi:hypothetical protein
MSTQGCLSAFFLGLILAWSLLIGAFVTAGWLGAEIIGFLTALFFADVDGARRASEGLLQALRAIGFGMFATIWAIGIGVIALFWFVSLRSAARTAATYRHSRVDIEVIDLPSDGDLKDVTPARDDRTPPRLPPPR